MGGGTGMGGLVGTGVGATSGLWNVRGWGGLPEGPPLEGRWEPPLEERRGDQQGPGGCIQWGEGEPGGWRAGGQRFLSVGAVLVTGKDPGVMWVSGGSGVGVPQLILGLPQGLLRLCQFWGLGHAQGTTLGYL